MKAIGKFILMDLAEFEKWLDMQVVTRKIRLVQQHHTYIPAYKHFKGNNHFELCRSMERSHIERGFSEIGQNLTIFPDGTVMACRNLDVIPAGIKGANTFGICIENIGNFDKGQDSMTMAQRDAIVGVTKLLLKRFKLTASENTVVYHHWYDLVLGRPVPREGAGNTKSCPGTNFFGGNTREAFRQHFLPLLLR